MRTGYCAWCGLTDACEGHATDEAKFRVMLERELARKQEDSTLDALLMWRPHATDDAGGTAGVPDG